MDPIILSDDAGGIWLALLALAWLLILCLVPPELVAQIGAWIRSARP